MSSEKENYIVWMDTEYSGLDLNKDVILEIACLISNKDLNVLSDEFSVVIHQPDEILNNMNEWCTEHHSKSGLTEECRSSKVSVEDAEQMLLTFLKKHIPRHTCPLAGNTIYQDRMFLNKYMPSVNNYLFYRIIDVSSIKELVKRWNVGVYKHAPKKDLHHRAMPDIKESIEELKYYRNSMFI